MFVQNLSQQFSPGPERKDLVTYTVKVNGSLVSDQFQITNLSVFRKCNKIPYASLRIIDSGPAEQRLQASDQDVFSPGNTIEISVGYSSDETLLFKGLIIRHGIKIQPGQSARVEVECKDETVKMSVGRKNRYFSNIKDHEIIRQILNTDYGGIIGEIEDTDAQHENMVQYSTTDWDFVLMRADANAQIVIPKDGTLIIQKPKFDEPEKFVLNYGSSIYEFEAEMDARDQYPSARTVAWDSAAQTLKVAEASENGPRLVSGGGIGGAISGAISGGLSGGLNGLIDSLDGSAPNLDYTQVIGIDNFLRQHSGMFTNEELQKWAEAQFQKSKLSKSKGRVRFDGYADIYPGDNISLQNVGARHSGKVFVTAVKHQVGEGSWFTEVQFGLPHLWFGDEYDDIQDKPASNLIPGVNGLQIGLVSKIEGDPESEDRILVRLPLVDKEAEGVWARVAAQDAGKGDNNEGRGAFFRPEVDDEVIVGFINDDPRNAIVLGMLNSSKKPAQIAATAQNDEKGWITRSGIKFLFNDQEKSILAETPDGRKITINDDTGMILLQDGNGNKIEMNSDGIVIESAQDLTLRAKNDVFVEGINVTQEAQQEMGLQGQAKAKFFSVGDVEIQGTFVKIN